MNLRCSRCEKHLPKRCFHKNKAQYRGYAHFCKECMKAYMKTPEIKRKRLTTAAAYRDTDEAKKKSKIRTKRFMAKDGYLERTREKAAKERNDPKNRIKIKSREKLNLAVISGKIIRLPCEVCGQKKSEAHHEDYSKPLDVRWLCRKHHKAIHSRLLRKAQGF